MDIQPIEIKLSCRYCNEKTTVHWISTKRSGGFTCDHCDMINMLDPLQVMRGDWQHRGALRSYLDAM